MQNLVPGGFRFPSIRTEALGRILDKEGASHTDNQKNHTQNAKRCQLTNRANQYTGNRREHNTAKSQCRYDDTGHKTALVRIPFLAAGDDGRVNHAHTEPTNDTIGNPKHPRRYRRRECRKDKAGTQHNPAPEHDRPRTGLVLHAATNGASQGQHTEEQGEGECCGRIVAGEKLGCDAGLKYRPDVGSSQAKLNHDAGKDGNPSGFGEVLVRYTHVFLRGLAVGTHSCLDFCTRAISPIVWCPTLFVKNRFCRMLL